MVIGCAAERVSSFPSEEKSSGPREELNSKSNIEGEEKESSYNQFKKIIALYFHNLCFRIDQNILYSRTS